MKISDKTLKVLQNFNSLNFTLKINKGNLLSTVNANSDKGYVSKLGNVLAVYKSEEDFPTTIRLGNLKQFLDVVKGCNEPVIDFQDNFVIISDTDFKIKISYQMSDEFIVTANLSEIEFDEILIEFIIDSKTFTKIKKFGEYLNNNIFEIVGKSEGVVLSLKDKDDSSKKFEMFIDKPCEDFKYYCLLNDIQIIQQDYKIIIGLLGEEPIMKLESLGDIPIIYYITRRNEE